MSDKKNPFVHLHVHTEYSMLDGLNRIPKLVEKVKKNGMNAVAMSDHGVMYGTYEFWTECRNAGIKPIIGCEIYVSPSERSLKEEVNGVKYYHLLLLAKNLKGYRNLVKLVSRAHLEGFYYKPRADRELLELYSEGLICSSACPSSPLGRHILRDESEKAKEWLEYLHNLYKDDFYLEIQRHGPEGSNDAPKDLEEFSEEQISFMKGQKKINTQLISWARYYDIPLIATTDAHYLEEDDEFTQEVLFAVKDGKSLDDPTRRKGYKNTYIKTSEEMANVYSDIPEVLVNTQKLADKVEEYDITFDRIQPRYPDLPDGKNAKEFLENLVVEGSKRKYGEMTDELRSRIDLELEVIHDKGYDDYFLVVSDIMKWARGQGIIVGARGSVGGSVVAYCLDIINIDPIEWELYFERFLNPERPSPPDIDMDIQDSRRDELIEYVENKYGRDNVCAIAAFGRLKTRTAIRDVSRVMNIDLTIADTLSKMVEVVFGKPKKIDWMIENNSEFRNIIESDSKIGDMATVVSKLDGQCRHVSTHACGYLITPEENTNYIPVQTETGPSNRIITQIEFGPLEDLGLMKFDFLGLSNLSIVGYTLKLIKEREGIDIDIYNVPLDDKKTFRLFQEGNTTNVFQFESSGMKRYLKELVPETLDDLCFMAAAYRPGPMQFIQGYIDCKHGRAEPEYIIPELKPILSNTYGFAIYQEQVIRIAVDIAGYSMGQADILRRAMGKKKTDVMKAEEEKFVNGCIDQGYTKEIGKKLFEYMLPFADYGFNKSHSATYAVIGYWTAFLKAHYSLEFMSARLTSDMTHPDKLTVALEEAKNVGLELLPPDINKSTDQFEPETDTSIRYGLNGIKNVGHNVVEEIIQNRKENGDFKNLDDLCIRITSINSRTIESLIKVGALSAFGSQSSLLQVYPSVLLNVSKERQRRASGQLGLLFGSNDNENSDIISTPLPQTEPVSTAEKLSWEKDLLGIYFTSHPMQAVIGEIEKVDLKQLSDCDIGDNKSVTGVALISGIRNITTKKGDPMAFITLEDTNKEVDSVLFPRDYKEYRTQINEGDIVVVSGRCKLRNGEISLIISKIKKFTDLDSVNQEEFNNASSGNGNINSSKKMTLVIHHSATSEDLRQLRDILLENPGDIEVQIHINNNGKSRTFKVRNKVSKEIFEEVIIKLPMIEEVKAT